MVVISYRQFAQTFLRSMAAKKIPVTTAIKFMRAEGISYRYAEMLRTYRSYSKVKEVADRYKYIPKKYRIPKALFGKIPYQTMPYLYEGVFEMRDKETGMDFLLDARTASDFHLTQNTVERECLKDSEAFFEKYNWEVTGFQVTAAFERTAF